MPVDRNARRILDLLAAMAPVDDAASSAEERRRSLIALAETAESAPEQACHIDDVAIRTDGVPLRLRFYRPMAAGTKPSAALVYLHGGGWVAGGIDTHDGFCRRLAIAAKCQLIALDYRLAPEHPFPAALNDCLAAFRWIADNAGSHRIEASRLAIGGDSTGAGLAAAASMSLRDDAIRPAAQVLICPVLDPIRESGSRRTFASGYLVERDQLERDLKAYCQGVDPGDSRVSPLRASDFSRLPQTIVHTAEFDPFRDEGSAYVSSLVRAGVRAREVCHAGMIHYFYAMARAIPYATVAAQAIGSDLGGMLQPVGQ